MDGQTGRHRNRQACRQADWQTDRQTNRQAGSVRTLKNTGTALKKKTSEEKNLCSLKWSTSHSTIRETIKQTDKWTNNIQIGSMAGHPDERTESERERERESPCINVKEKM